MNKQFYTYIMTNCRNTVFYTGVTADLADRLDQHKHKDNPKSFTARYNVDKLIYYEVFESIADAINREKKIKGWSRQKKIDLIKTLNPNFRDISDTLD